MVILKQSTQSKAIRDGNPLVFPKAVQKLEHTQSSPPKMASLVQVCDVINSESLRKTDSKIGWGVYNPNSLYQVRILCHRKLQPTLFKKVEKELEAGKTEKHAMELMIRHFVRHAIATRRTLGLFDGETDTYRLINGEGDGLSGLVVDVIGNSATNHSSPDAVLVVLSSALWCQTYHETISMVLQEEMSKIFSNRDSPMVEVVWRPVQSRLKQDAGGSENSAIDDYTELFELGTTTTSTSFIDNTRPMHFRENGVKFLTYPLDGGQATQKTSVYCDQRENRQVVAEWTDGKRVLDLCCYHGGFGITALVKGHARSVVAVDSSKVALEIADENARLNGLTGNKIQFFASDVTPFCQDEFKKESFYDLIILDPPKLAPTVSSLAKARRKYHALNRDAIKLINPEKGGIFVTCTCSAVMTHQREKVFLPMVQGAALAAGRSVSLLRVTGAASCHVQGVGLLGSYLTMACWYVGAVEE